MKAVVIGEPSGKSMEEISKVFPRHKAVMYKFVARGDVIGIGPFADLGNYGDLQDPRCGRGVRKGGPIHS